MGAMLDSTNTEPCSGRDEQNHSGFNGPYCNTTSSKTDGINFGETKYYDIYKNSTSDSFYQRRILGDATGEMGPFAINESSRTVGSWNNNQTYFLRSWASWFARGGVWDCGTEAGVFTFYDAPGITYSSFGFRVVLSV